MKAEEQQVVQAQLDSPVVAANATILEDRSFQKKKRGLHRSLTHLHSNDRSTAEDNV